MATNSKFENELFYKRMNNLKALDVDLTKNSEYMYSVAYHRSKWNENKSVQIKYGSFELNAHWSGFNIKCHDEVISISHKL